MTIETVGAWTFAAGFTLGLGTALTAAFFEGAVLRLRVFFSAALLVAGWLFLELGFFRAALAFFEVAFFFVLALVVAFLAFFWVPF